MSFDLGALVTRLVVQGGSTFRSEVKGAGDSLEGAAAKSNKLGGELNKTSTASTKASKNIRLVGVDSGMAAGAVEGLGTGARATGVELGVAGTEAEVLGKKVKVSASEAVVAGGMFTQMGDKSKAAFTTAAIGAGLAGAALVGLTAVAVHENSDYEKEMSKVVAVTGAYGQTLQDVRQLTIDLGAQTTFTATEAGQGVENLGKAGVSTSAILDGALKGSLNLAAAGEESVADAAETAATALVQFNLPGSEAVHVSDLLAAGAGKAQGSVGDMSLALKQGGLVASQFGLSVDDTVGGLAAFASAGLIGSDAGTSFKQMLLQLASPTTQAQALLKKYNIEAYDAQGNFVGLTDLAGQLQTGFEGATQAERNHALAIIFGTDAIRAANVLYTDGASGIQGWTDNVNDSGYAARFAAQMQNNLSGDVEKLGGSLDTVAIQSGSAFNDTLRDMVQNLTGVVNWYSALDPALQKSVTQLGFESGAILLVSAALLGGVPRLASFLNGLRMLSTEAPILTGRLKAIGTFLTGPWGIALVAGVTALTVLNHNMEASQATAGEMENSLSQAANATQVWNTAVKGMVPVPSGLLAGLTGKQFDTKDMQNELKDLDGYLDKNSDQWGTWWGNLFTPDQGNKMNTFNQALAKVDQGLSDLSSSDFTSAQKGFQTLAAQTDGSQKSLHELLDQLPLYKAALVTQAQAQGINVTTTSDAVNEQALLTLAMQKAAPAAQQDAIQIGAVSAAASDATGDIKTLADEIKGFGSATLDSRASERAFQAAVDDAEKSVKKNGATLDVHTEKGRANQDALDGIAKSANEAAAAILTQTGSIHDSTKRLDEGREAVIQYGEKMGLSSIAAKNLADKLVAIPSQIEFEVKSKGLASTDADLNRVLTKIKNIDGTVAEFRIHSTVDGPGQKAKANGDIVRHRASGAIDRAPMIAKAGSNILWAENETGDEAYIPYAASKRGRSTALLSQVAGDFGYMLVPAGTAQAANGAISRGSAAIPDVSGAGTRTVQVHMPVQITVQSDSNGAQVARQLAQLQKAGIGIGSGISGSGG